MELRYIRYFIVLAEELNFTKAAERLHIAQPPLSRQIQKLEEEVGAKLFHRTKRKVELTNAGKVFLTKAYQIVDQVEQASISARLSSTGLEGEFRIGFTGAIQDMIPTLKRYRERFPNVGMILKHMTSSEQLEALSERTIDIAVISIAVNSHHIQTRPIRNMTFVAVLPDHHPLASKQSLTIRDLANETFIITPKSAGPMYYDMVMDVFKNSYTTPKTTIQAHDLQTVLALVASGMGWTIAPKSIHPIGGIVQREMDELRLAVQARLAWLTDNESEILQNFLTFFFGDA